MDFFHVVAAVALGNLIAAALIACIVRSLKQSYTEASWLTLLTVLLIGLFMIWAISTVEGPLPLLAG